MNPFENTDLIRRLITTPDGSVEAVAFRCAVISIAFGKVELKFSIVDRDGKTLRELSTDRLSAGENITLFNFSQFFKVTIAPVGGR